MAKLDPTHLDEVAISSLATTLVRFTGGFSIAFIPFLGLTRELKTSCKR